MAHARPTSDRHSLWLLTLAPTIWMTHLLLCYATAAVWCGKFVSVDGTLNGVPAAIAWYTVVALVGLTVIGWEGLRRHRYVPSHSRARGADGGATSSAADDGPPHDREQRVRTVFESGGTEATTHDLDTPEDRHRFLGFATLLLSGLSAVAVMYAARAATYFEACR